MQPTAQSLRGSSVSKALPKQYANPCYLRGRMSEMRSMIEEDDVEIRLSKDSRREKSRLSEVWIRRASIGKSFPDVQEALSKLELKPAALKLGKAVIISAGGTKSRAVLEGLGVSRGTVKYRNVDSGWSFSACRDQVYGASLELLAIPVKAWRCQIDISSSPKAIHMTNWTKARICVLKWNAVPTVHLRSESDCDKHNLDFHEDYAHLFDFRKPIINNRSQLKPFNKLRQRLYCGLPGITLPGRPLASLSDCWVLGVTWPYVHFVSATMLRNMLPEDRPIGGEIPVEGRVLFEAKPGSLCIGRIGTKFARMAVSSVSGESASVVLVDTGSRGMLRVNDLQHLPTSQRDFAPACVTGRLPDHYLARCTDEATLKLLVTAAGPLQIVIVKYTDEKHIPVVRLFGAAGREICVD